MISKEEFIHEVEKERQIWKKIQEEQGPKWQKKDVLHNPVLFYFICFFVILIMESISPSNTTRVVVVGIILISFIFVLRTEPEDGLAKSQQEHYEKMLSLLGVKKVTDKRFHKFSFNLFGSFRIFSPAYQIAHLIVQNFPNLPRYARHRVCIWAFYSRRQCLVVSSVMIFFEKSNKGKSRGFQKLYRFKKDNPIRQIGEQFYDFFKIDLCSGYQNESEHQIMLDYFWGYKKKGWGYECPFCFLKKTTPHDLLVSNNYKFGCNKIYEEIVFFNKISKMIDEI